jgi:putative peptide zinc metalloprotease protein
VRKLLASLLALPLALQPAPAAAAGGPSNIVIAMNHSDGRLVVQGNIGLSREPGAIAAPLNFAMAYSSCTDCRTIAVALQLNFATTDAHLITPQNGATATNANCTHCATVAIADQVFYTVDDPTQIPPGVQDSILQLDAALREISTDPTITFDDALARIDGVLAQFMATATAIDAQRSIAP